MKILGIDFGIKRVGLALTDPGGVLAYPLPAIERTTRDALFADLTALVEREGVERVVVGLPLGLDGQDTETTRQARNFAASLARRVEAPVELADERFSSLEAEGRLREAGGRGRKVKQKLDSQAAVIILETWLARNVAHNVARNVTQSVAQNAAKSPADNPDEESA
ncbi:MAG: Holliday junction resolvase RuvX [Desulfovibrionaceae bacterium]